MVKKGIFLSTFMFLILIKSLWAQLDVRVTSAYGNIFLRPKTPLNITSESENFLTAGLQLDYYFSDNFGIGIGADYYLRDFEYNVILNDYSHSYRGIDNWEIDPIPREYEFTIESNNTPIVEQNAISIIEIPLSAIYSVHIANDLYLVSRLGIKLGLPIETSYRLQSSDLFTRLYFEEWDLELFNIPAHGLYDSRTDWHPEGELNLNNPLSLFSELGIDFPLSSLKVRLSGYFSYGLNNIIEEKQSSLIYWREDYNPVLTLAESVKLMQFGVKVGIGLISQKERKTKYNSRVKCAWEY